MQPIFKSVEIWTPCNSVIFGGWTTLMSRIERFFPVLLSKKFYLKNCVQGDQKPVNHHTFMHTLYTGSKNGPAKLRCWVKEFIKNIFDLLQIFRNFHRFWVI